MGCIDFFAQFYPFLQFNEFRLQWLIETFQIIKEDLRDSLNWG